MAFSGRLLFRNFCEKVPKIRFTGVRQFGLSSVSMGAHDVEFAQAKEALNSLSEDPGNEVKLKIYGLFKQATVGQCNAPKPGLMDIVGKAKWNAWNSLGNISQDEAQKQYIDLVSSLVAAQSPAVEMSPTSADGEGSKYTEIKVTNENGVSTILLNRPKKKNALTLKMYEEIGQALSEAAEDSNVVLTVMTGAGDFYCSGNDLSNFMNIPPEGVAQMAKDANAVLRKYIACYIDFPKPLIALVNGPAVGVSVTVLGLFDLVYASDKATFHTPFSSLGQTPEGCSSYTFPKIMGLSKATEMLVFDRKLTAREASDRGLVTDVFPDDSFQKEAWQKVNKFAKLPKNTMRFSKGLIRSMDNEVLHKVNAAECNRLEERWQGDECMNAIMNFFQSKAKL